MNPKKADREHVQKLTDLPNVGPATERDLHLLGIREPENLIGRCPFKMYNDLCEKTGIRQDPCVIDVFLSVTEFMNGGKPRPWWEFTEERKRMIARKSRR
jgi:hypothetical protein